MTASWISEELPNLRRTPSDIRDIENFVRCLAQDGFTAESLYSELVNVELKQKVGYLSDVALVYQRFLVLGSDCLLDLNRMLRQWLATQHELKDVDFGSTEFIPDIVPRAPGSYCWNVVTGISVYDLVSDWVGELHAFRDGADTSQI